MLSDNSFYSRNELNEKGFAFLGKNVLISKMASIYGANKMSIGNNVRIDDFCVLSGKIDLGNYIHIAAYNRSNAGSLYYAYLDSYNSPFDEKKNLVKVDSYGSTGQYITMEVAKDSKGNNIPYIGYWMNSMSYPKYAYLVDTDISDGPKPGVDENNRYTGAWESIMIPTSSDILRDDINIGLYRYKEAENGHLKGEIREIPRQTETAGEKFGVAGGNGTKNPVFAYGISETGSGYIETAQLK